MTKPRASSFPKKKQLSHPQHSKLTKLNNQGGSDQDTHHLIDIKVPPASLIALREELQHHPEIAEYAQKGNSFEECIGIIAAHLDIVMDGMYDVQPMCAMLVEALRNKRFFGGDPSILAQGLIDVELVEKEGTVEIVKRDRNVTTILPEGAVVTNTNTDKTTPSQEKDFSNFLNRGLISPYQDTGNGTGQGEFVISNSPSNTRGSGSLLGTESDRRNDEGKGD